jgi:hypothetical protein
MLDSASGCSGAAASPPVGAAGRTLQANTTLRAPSVLLPHHIEAP